MKIVLRDNVDGLGKRGEVLDVSDGYSRNYLIPKGLAMLATETNKKVLAEVVKQKSHKEEKIKNEAEEVAKALEGLALKIGAKSGTSGKIFGSVNALQIASAIKDDHNMEIDRKLIIVDGDSIKELGQYTAKVKLHKEVEVELKFEVVAE